MSTLTCGKPTFVIAVQTSRHKNFFLIVDTKMSTDIANLSARCHSTVRCLKLPSNGPIIVTLEVEDITCHSIYLIFLR